MLVLHEGPSWIVPGRPGNKAVLNVLGNMPPMLVCCATTPGRVIRWDEQANGTQVLNVDAKAYLYLSDEIKPTGDAS
jgi:hypothetical protein